MVNEEPRFRNFRYDEESQTLFWFETKPVINFSEDMPILGSVITDYGHYRIGEIEALQKRAAENGELAVLAVLSEAMEIVNEMFPRQNNDDI